MGKKILYHSSHGINQEEQMKIPKIDERQRKGVWVSGAQSQLDDAVCRYF